MFCKKCGQEISDQAVICVNCGCSTQEKPVNAAAGDAPSVGMAILGYFIPLVGFIVWLLNKDTKPLMAKSAGKGALVGLVVNTILGTIVGVVTAFMLTDAMYYYW